MFVCGAVRLEDGDLAREVRVDVGSLMKAMTLRAGELLRGGGDLRPHRALNALPDAQHVLLPLATKAAFHLDQRVFDEHHDGVVADGRAT